MKNLVCQHPGFIFPELLKRSTYLIVIFVIILCAGVDALKFFSVTIFCGKFSPLKYMIRLQCLIYHIEPMFCMFESTEPMQSTFLPFNPDICIYMYICMCLCVCRHIYIYIYICLHTHISLQCQ